MPTYVNMAPKMPAYQNMVAKRPVVIGYQTQVRRPVKNEIFT